MNVHLCHDDSELRGHQLRAVLEHAERHAPALIMGDLNSTPPATRSAEMLEAELYRSDRCMDMLVGHAALSSDPRVRACLAGAPLHGLANYPSGHPVLKLDYLLLVDPAGELSLRSERVVATGPEISDHRPVVAVLEWPET